MYVLLLDSDSSLSSFLKKGLSQEGYNVLVLSRLLDLNHLFVQQNTPNPYLILLSSRIEDVDSLQLLIRLKEHWKESPIMVLFDSSDPHQKSRFLDAGADDCMSRPISLEELSARIRVLRRRAKGHSGHRILIGDTSIDFLQQVAFVNEARVSLSRKEYEVLRLFMEHPQRVYSKCQILEQVWDIHSEVESNVVEVTIKNLRKKLNQMNSHLKIDCRRHFGYWLNVSEEGTRTGSQTPPSSIT